jgi:hypothetical protein
METLLGHDFNDVLIHDDAMAQDSADAINAKAYTAGRHIVFGRKMPAVETTSGRQTLAHELAHVVQQGGADTTGSLSLGEPGDRYERQADEIANLAGGTAPLAAALRPATASPARVQRADGGLKPDEIVVRAVHLTPEEFFLLTGIDPASVPDQGVGATMLPTGPMLSAAPMGSQYPVGTTPGQIPPQSVLSYGVGLPLVGMRMPTSPIPLNATGFMWGSGHLSLFSNVDGNLTIRGFRGPLATHAGADIFGGPFTERLNVGVPGSFAQDLFFSMWPFQDQTLVFRSVDSGAARSFADVLRSAEYDTTYRYSPPPPGSEAFARLYPDGNPCPTANCLTVPAREIELALGQPIELPTPGGLKNLQTGAVAGGSPAPTQAGRASEMRSYVNQPEEFFNARGLTRMPGQPWTMGARVAVPYVRVGGYILLIYGIYKTGDRLYDAWGTEDFPIVAAEEAGSWTGGILGSVAAGAVAGAILCAPTGPIDLVCVVGGAAAGLIGGMIGGAVGAKGGRVAAEETRSWLRQVEQDLQNFHVYLMNMAFTGHPYPGFAGGY